MYTKQQLLTKAKSLGATHCRVYNISSKRGKLEPYAWYFFNKNDEEICYYIEDTYRKYGLTVLKQPKIWSQSFKDSPKYELINNI